MRDERFLESPISSGPGRARPALAPLHPRYASDGRFDVDYTDRNGDTQVVEYTARDGAAQRATARGLLSVRQPAANHNGGMLAFGPDGSSTSASVTAAAATPTATRRTDALLGKILRIDVDAPPANGHRYAIPANNPFAPTACDPVGAPRSGRCGLRNPWRSQLRRAPGDLSSPTSAGTCGGDRPPARHSAVAQDYGWNVMEGRSASPDRAATRAHATDRATTRTTQALRGHRRLRLPRPCAAGARRRLRLRRLLLGCLLHAPGRRGNHDAKGGPPLRARGVELRQAEDGELYLTDVAGGTIQHVVVAE